MDKKIDINIKDAVIWQLKYLISTIAGQKNLNNADKVELQHVRQLTPVVQELWQRILKVLTERTFYSN